MRALSKVLPEGWIKDKGRIFIYKKIMARNWLVPVKKIECAKNKLFVELENGLKFVCYSPEKWKMFGQLHGQLHLNYYEKHYTIKSGDIVVDAGANIGTFAVLAAKEAGENGMVIAIELQKDNLENLKKNIELNALKNVIVIPKGLWNSSGKMNLYLGTIESHSLVHNSSSTEEIEVDTLDNILRELRIKKVDFKKMNIEGAEIQAIDGMKHTLLSNKVHLVVAPHVIDGTPLYHKIIPLLKGMDFEACEENIENIGQFVYATNAHKGLNEGD